MTASASSEITVAPSIWRNAASWIKSADIAVVLLAMVLPWSTSLVAIFAVIWLVLLIPAIDLRGFLDTMKRPACAIPIIFFLLAVAGTLWAADTLWASRLRGISPVTKLLAIPVLIYHFQRSERGLWVALAFLVSCTVLMLLSWLSVGDARFVLDQTKSPGVPVKNYIAQSQEFALCAFGAFGAAVYAWEKQKALAAVCLAFLGIGFLANLVFVASSRTVLVCIPVLFVIFAVMHFKKNGLLVMIFVMIAAGAIGWTASPHLRERASAVVTEYQGYRGWSENTSTGQRLEFWRKSIKFIQEAPVAGHGTGATRALFVRDAVGKTGVSAEVIGNPHNQTLNVAVQWGVLGFAVLYAMWFAHLKLFVGAASLSGWIGLVAVTENFVSSLFNSHLFDFTEGWMYVLAVGVAGGMVSRRVSPKGREARA